MTGAFRSPAMWMHGTSADVACIWCKTEVGHQNHMMWECEKRPKRMDKPRCPLQARLGWPVGENEGYDEQVIEWMMEVVNETWSQRYKKRERGQTEENQAREESVNRGDNRGERGTVASSTATDPYTGAWDGRAGTTASPDATASPARRNTTPSMAPHLLTAAALLAATATATMDTR